MRSKFAIKAIGLSIICGVYGFGEEDNRLTAQYKSLSLNQPNQGIGIDRTPPPSGEPVVVYFNPNGIPPGEYFDPFASSSSLVPRLQLNEMERSSDGDISDGGLSADGERRPLSIATGRKLSDKKLERFDSPSKQFQPDTPFIEEDYDRQYPSLPGSQSSSPMRRAYSGSDSQWSDVPALPRIPRKITPRGSHTWPEAEQKIYLQINQLIDNYKVLPQAKTLRQLRDRLRDLTVEIRKLTNEVPQNEQLQQIHRFYLSQTNEKASMLNKQLANRGEFDAHGYLVGNWNNLKRWTDLVQSMQQFISGEWIHGRGSLIMGTLAYRIITGKSIDIVYETRRTSSMRFQLEQILMENSIPFEEQSDGGLLLIPKNQISRLISVINVKLEEGNDHTPRLREKQLITEGRYQFLKWVKTEQLAADFEDEMDMDGDEQPGTPGFRQVDERTADQDFNELDENADDEEREIEEEEKAREKRETEQNIIEQAAAEKSVPDGGSSVTSME